MLILWSKSELDILTFSTSNLRFIVLFLWFIDRLVVENFDKLLQKYSSKREDSWQGDSKKSIRSVTNCSSWINFDNQVFFSYKNEKKSAPGEIRTQNR